VSPRAAARQSSGAFHQSAREPSGRGLIRHRVRRRAEARASPRDAGFRAGVGRTPM